MHPAASLVVRMVSSISPLSALRATFPVRGDSFTLPPVAFFHRLRGPLLRGCPRHPALRAHARGYAACKDLRSSIVRAHQLKDLFHRLRGPPSPGMPPASRASRPCAGTALSVPLGKLSAQLTEGVPARRIIVLPCKQTSRITISFHRAATPIPAESPIGPAGHFPQGENLFSQPTPRIVAPSSLSFHI